MARPVVPRDDDAEDYKTCVGWVSYMIHQWTFYGLKTQPLSQLINYRSPLWGKDQ